MISASAVKFNRSLKDLFLGDNKLISSDGQCLGAMLKGNQTLQLLDLRNNPLQVSAHMLYMLFTCWAVSIGEKLKLVPRVSLLLAS